MRNHLEVRKVSASKISRSSQAEAQLVSAAWKCARGAYDLESTIEDTAYCTFRKDHVLKHSLTGTVKALKSTVVEPVAKSSHGDHLLPALVIAVRGSASKMDHIVNANSRPQVTEKFIVRLLFRRRAEILYDVPCLTSADFRFPR